MPGGNQWTILRHLVWDLPVRGVICLRISFVCLVVSIQAMPTLGQNGSFHIGFKTAAAAFTVFHLEDLGALWSLVWPPCALV